MRTARDKLNVVAVKGALFVGGIVALIFQSLPVGILAAAGIFLSALISGDFRPKSDGGHSDKRRSSSRFKT